MCCAAQPAQGLPGYYLTASGPRVARSWRLAVSHRLSQGRERMSRRKQTDTSSDEGHRLSMAAQHSCPNTPSRTPFRRSLSLIMVRQYVLSPSRDSEARDIPLRALEASGVAPP